MKSRKAIIIFIVFSFLANIGFIYSKIMETALFGSDIFFSAESLKVSGVFIYSDKKKQPDPKKHVQHLFIKCWEKECSSVESYLMGDFINIETREVKVLELNYQNKTATFEAFGCRISVAEKAASFTCKDGDVGEIGSHIKLFYDNYPHFGRILGLD